VQTGESNEATEATDEELVAAILDGDARAFETLLHRHETRVLRVLRLLGVGIDDREDVAQEVFVRVFRHLRGFRHGNSFGGWLYRIAVNAAHDYKKQMRLRAGRESPLSPAQEEPAGSADRSGEAARILESRRRLEAALSALSERERAVFVLMELEGLETVAVAKSLGITRITVRRHLSRARSRLERHLREPQKKSCDG
jgi:RNA polymerase sigma-70 factor (ECF subfamily)